MGGEFGGVWIFVYVWLSPFAIYLTVNRLHHNTKKKSLKKKGARARYSESYCIKEKKSKRMGSLNILFSNTMISYEKKKAIFKASVFKKTYK